MIEMVRAWKVAWNYFLDEAKAQAYTRELDAKYSHGKPGSFEPKPTYLLKVEMNGKTGYLLLNQLESNHKVIE